MGVIKDINDKIAPRAQELTEKQGLSIKQALVKSFEEYGYLESDKKECVKMDNYYIKPDEYEKALKNGISKRTLEQRIWNYGWDKQRALTEPVKKRINRKKWMKIAEENGISSQTFSSRVFRLNWDEHKAATTPVMKHKGLKSKFSEEVIKKCEKNGVPIQTFRRRVKDGWDIEIACTRKPLTVAESSALAKIGREKRRKKIGKTL